MLSVVIPVFNAERFIEKAVGSVINQEEAGEIILVEDNSTDNSLELCRKIEKEHSSIVKFYRHIDGKNYGAGATRNLGIEKSTGEFIAFLDADDYYLPGRFKRDFEILHNDPEIDGVYNALGNHIYDKDEQNRIKFNLTTVNYPIPPEKLFEEMSPIGTSGYWSCDTLTVRRTIFDKVGLFDTTLKISQDTHMWIKMAAKAVLVAGIIEKPVAMRGVHIGNRIKNRCQLDYYRPLLFLSLLKWAEENNLPVQRKKKIWDCAYKFYKKSDTLESCGFLTKKINLLFFFTRYGVRYYFK